MVFSKELTRKMFNRSAKSHAALIFEKLSIEKKMGVADIGVGGGYFALEFARRVGEEGTVFAVDTEQYFLDSLMQDAFRENVRNIQPILTWGNLPSIPATSCDLIFLRGVYHHIEVDRVAYFASVRDFLKPGGTVAIIDYKIENLHRVFGHATSPQTIRDEMAAAGYALLHSYDILPGQSFMIFAPQ